MDGCGCDRALFERDSDALSSDAESNRSDRRANAGSGTGSECWNNSLGSASGVPAAGLLERIEKATAVLMSRDPRLAEEFIREKDQIKMSNVGTPAKRGSNGHSLYKALRRMSLT
jgi:hypothetical protein